MKLDILVLAAHPDDAEISCAGTIARHVAMGHKVGIVDFTKGELGTRGTVEIRAEEAAAAAKILGVSVRENLGLTDGFFQNDATHQLAVIRAIRKYQPVDRIGKCVYDRHIDHGKGASLAYDACFLSGLVRIETKDENGKNRHPGDQGLYIITYRVYTSNRILLWTFRITGKSRWRRSKLSSRSFMIPKATNPKLIFPAQDF